MKELSDNSLSSTAVALTQLAIANRAANFDQRFKVNLPPKRAIWTGLLSSPDSGFLLTALVLLFERGRRVETDWWKAPEISHEGTASSETDTPLTDVLLDQFSAYYVVAVLAITALQEARRQRLAKHVNQQDDQVHR